MKKIKHFALGIISAILVTAGLYSCNNEEVNNPQQENTEQNPNLQSRSDGDVLIAYDDEGTINLLFDKNDFEASLTSEEIFAEVENIEIEEDILTIIGKKSGDFSLIAFQAELIRDGNNLYFPDPEIPELPITTFATHECNGSGCSSCSFVYEIKSNGKNGKIIGCDCNDTGSCDHKITDKDQADKNKDTAKTILEILKSIF